MFGGDAGYNWQYGSVVAGLEVDFDGADIKQTITPLRGISVEEKIDELASARARLGYVFFQNLLAYGPAGAGWGHFHASSPLLGSLNSNEFGWTAAAALVSKFFESLLLRSENLHY